MNAWPVLRGATLGAVLTAGPDLDRRAERLSATASAAERSESAGYYTTRIFVAQAIVAAVICGFVN